MEFTPHYMVEGTFLKSIEIFFGSWFYFRPHE